MIRSLLPLSLIVLLPACATTMNDPGYDYYGAGVREDEAVAAAEIMAQPAAFDGKNLLVTGTIVNVCQTKGCWMRIGTTDQNVFVKFKDYGFFMPMDSAGRTVVMEGTLAVKMVPVDEARHYLEDVGKHDEAQKITEPKREVTFEATGVAIKK